MPASKDRPLWAELPADVCRGIERIAGARVVADRSQSGGFSPGLAARLGLADGRRVFAKAIGAEWPIERPFHRREARIAAALPAGVPAPALLGTLDNGDWIALVFADIDGHEPAQPWRAAELERVVAAVSRLSSVGADSLTDDHPRLGGWSELDAAQLDALPGLSPWAAT